eukprot:Clim_evm15s22 gene=Clim_evmTU15s22
MTTDAVAAAATAATTTERSVLVLYGSETGTAADTAEAVRRALRRMYVQARVMPCDDYDIADLPAEPIIIYVLATAGQGELPENMSHFWRFLRRRGLASDSLAGIKFAVFGLGDSSYHKYNFAAKKVRARMSQLGANEMIPIGLGDDQHDHGPDHAFVPWIELLLEAMLKIFPLPAKKEMRPEYELEPPRYIVKFRDERGQDGDNGMTTDDEDRDGDKVDQPPGPNNAFMARVVANDRVTAEDHFQETRHIVLDIKNSGMRFEPGDVAYVRPRNLPERVDDVLKMMRWDPDRVLTVTEPDEFTPLPPGMPRTLTQREVLEGWLDVFSMPRRHFFEVLSFFATNPMQRERLVELSASDGQQDLLLYMTRMKRNVYECLMDFDSTHGNVPFEYIFNLIGPMRPRAFSIASSQTQRPDRLELLVGVVTYRTKMATPRLGICSNWLASLKPSSSSGPSVHRVPVWVRKGTFQLTPAFRNLAVPLVMVGPGTGMAPFRAMIQERVALAKQNQSQDIDQLLPLSKRTVLFFGCRYEKADNYFRAELDGYAEEGLCTILRAYSREQGHKFYVQNVMGREHELIRTALDRSGTGYFLIAGNAKRMPDEVHIALHHALTLAGMEVDEAKKFLVDLEKKRRYQTETWA